VCGYGSAESKKRAAKIERIARVRVRSGDGEDFLLVEMACGKRANEQSERAHERTQKNGPRSWARKPQDDDGKGVAETHAPARKKCG